MLALPVGVRLSKLHASLGLALLSLFLLACSGDDTPETASGPRFLLATTEGLIERNSSGERTLLSFDDGSYIFDPAVSPDGKRIAFIRQAPASVDVAGNVDFGADLYVVDANGRNSRELLHHTRTGEFLRNPAWLSNDELLINIRGRHPAGLPDLRVERLNVTSGQRQRLLQDAVEIGIAPDAKSFAFVHIEPNTQREQLMLFDMASGQSQALTQFDSPLVFIVSIVFAPDGNTVAFAAADPSTGSLPGPASRPAHPTLQDAWLVDKDGANLRRLAELAESQPSLEWTSDGRALYALGTGSLWLIEATTGAMEQLGPGITFGQIRLLSD